jgi:hypothetical protein
MRGTGVSGRPAIISFVGSSRIDVSFRKNQKTISMMQFKGHRAHLRTKGG